MTFLRTLPDLPDGRRVLVQPENLSRPLGHPGLGVLVSVCGVIHSKTGILRLFPGLTLIFLLTAAVFLRTFLKRPACLVDAIAGGVDSSASHIPRAVADLHPTALKAGAEGVVHGVAESAYLPFQFILHLLALRRAIHIILCVVVFVHSFLIPLPGCTG